MSPRSLGRDYQITSSAPACHWLHIFVSADFARSFFHWSLVYIFKLISQVLIIINHCWCQKNCTSDAQIPCTHFLHPFTGVHLHSAQCLQLLSKTHSILKTFPPAVACSETENVNQCSSCSISQLWSIAFVHRDWIYFSPADFDISLAMLSS